MFFSDGIQLHFIINHIGELFTILVLLETLIANTSLTANWAKYCKNLKSYSSTPDKLGLNEDKYKALIGAVDKITAKIMNDDIVENSLRNLSSLRKNLVDKKCSLVANEFIQYLKQAITNLDKLVQEQPTISNMYKCIKINALFVLNSHLFGSNDKKIFKNLMELNVKVNIYCAVQLYHIRRNKLNSVI